MIKNKNVSRVLAASPDNNNMGGTKTEKVYVDDMKDSQVKARKTLVLMYLLKRKKKKEMSLNRKGVYILLFGWCRQTRYQVVAT